MGPAGIGVAVGVAAQANAISGDPKSTGLNFG